MEENKKYLWELIAQDKQDNAIATILYLMDIIADENKQTGNINTNKNNIAKDYRAMLAAA